MSALEKALLFCAMCALRAYDYYRVFSSPECAALEIRDFSQALRLDVLFLLYLWLLLFRLDNVRALLKGLQPYVQKGALAGFFAFALAGWILSSHAAHDACRVKNMTQPTAEAKAMAASTAAFIRKHQAANAAASAASAAALRPPSVPASAGQKAYTH